MPPIKKYLITIVGPTAIGKTALSLQLAKAFNCEIISCDSRQFFKEMTIGTAVPNAEELAFTKHHFIHNKSIFDDYTVGDFEKDALDTLANLFTRGNYAIMVGGSGLYVDAVLKGFDSFPEIDESVRHKIKSDYEALGISHLQQQLKKYDPDYYAAVDIGNPQRMMRALEVAIGSGRPYSSFLNLRTNTREFIPIIIGIDAERNIIYERINQRVDIMLREGLLEEARGLYPFRDRNALQTVGYRELFEHFNGNITLEFAIAEIKKNTRRFAKRQLTWFRKNEAVNWFDFEENPKFIEDYILRNS